ncbi:MAG: choice-of-anchor tandem repeat GloVer-containing protein [Verrucomicrobiota bacterium]
MHIFSTATRSVAPLAQGPDGTLYGVSASGGVSGPPGNGTVFKVQPDGSGFSIIYSFTNGNDGSGPAAGLIMSGNTLYGTAESGGSGGHGTVFKINTDGTGLATIYSFTAYTPGTNSDGANPQGSLVLSGNTLHGTASVGGSANSYGTIFKVNTDGTGFTKLHTFGLVGVSDPAYPLAGMVLSGSTLYGTTSAGGSANGGGTVFKIDTSGTGFAIVHAFPGTVSGTNSDGAHPKAGLVLSGGMLYGTASGGGEGWGTVFSVSTDGSSFTNLYNFTNGVDGSTPGAALTLSGGTLYGTASSGGNWPGWGTVFKLHTDSTGFTNLYEFAQGDSGTQPEAGLLLSGSTLYGTTPNTSGYTGGTVFKLGTDGSGFTVLANGSDGAQPQGGLVLSGDSFYGTTSAGGVAGAGVVFKVNTNGTGFATLHVFTAATNESAAGDNSYANSDGATPLGTLASAGGVLYGTTEIGGTFGVGTIFRVNTDGTGFTNLYSFTNGLDGAFPTAGLVLSGSTLYGTAGGSQPFPAEVGGNESTIFKINTDGTGFTNLYDFSAAANGTNSDGNGPLAGLVLGGDTLYGTAHYGGPGGAGTLFKINTNGTGFAAFYSFPVPLRGINNDPDGANPAAGLILSGNTLYGTTSYGGTKASLDPRDIGGPGTIFRVNTDGTGFATLYELTNTFGGSVAMGALALSGGALYGTASIGGNGSAGTVFQINTDGTGFTPLHAFPFQQGKPVGDLVAIGNTVYGTCEYGAPASGSSIAGSGLVFAVTPTATPSIEFTASPTNGIPPQTVQFTAPGVDDRGNTIIEWKWNFGDGAQFQGAANPTHTYTNEGPFTPTLIAGNNNGATIIGSGPAIAVVYPGSILNGGFETGTFTNWTAGGNFGQSSPSASANYVHSGKYGAALSAYGSLGYLSQTLSTLPGAVYSISFWLHNPTSKTNNEFQVSWNGTVLLDMTNLPVIGWTNIQLTVTAAAGTAVLKFGYRNDTAYFGLDDISVSSAAQPPGIAGISLAGANLVLNGTAGLSGRTYFVLMWTNLTEPLNQWAPVATNVPVADGNFSITATNAVNPNAPQRFYILQLQ